MVNKYRIIVIMLILSFCVLSAWFLRLSNRKVNPNFAAVPNSSIRPNANAVEANLVNLHPHLVVMLSHVSLTPTTALLGPTATSPKRPAMRLNMVVSCAGSPPKWWDNQGKSLTGFRFIDRKGKITSIHEGYFGISQPEPLCRDNVDIQYTLPVVVTRQNLSAIHCILTTSSGMGAEVPLANITIQ